MNDDVMMRMPLSFEPITANDLRDALTTNIYANDNYLCENPWTIRGIEAEPEIKIDGNTLSEIIRKAVQEAIQEENMLATPKIEKYHIKHK